jgi:putative transcriptional regulator
MPIQWRLAAVMAERAYSNKKLAELMSFHEVTISKLRKSMPDRLEKETLEKLCTALKCQPGDLMRWVAEGAEETEEMPKIQVTTTKPVAQQAKNTRALRAKATRTRIKAWDELRQPLSINHDSSTT